MVGFLILAVFALACAAFFAAQRKALAIAGGKSGVLHSRPVYHGSYCLIAVLLVGWGLLLVLGTGSSYLIDSTLMSRIVEGTPDSISIQRDVILSDAKAIASGGVPSTSGDLRQEIAARYNSLDALRAWGLFLVVLLASVTAGLWAVRQVAADFRARNRTERLVNRLLLAAAAIAIATTVGIVLSLIFETLTFLRDIGWRVDKFLFGLNWSPLRGVFQGDLEADNVGAVPLFLGTFMITGIAMLVAVPIGLFSAIYLSDFAAQPVRAVAKPMLELLAGIPTVVYGFFAAITVAPVLRDLGETVGLDVSSRSALAAGVVMGIMIIPFISSLSDDVINAVPQSLRDGSFGLGATRAETMRQIILPAALPGIVSAILLAISRAVGETMIVVMAAGQGPNLTANPLEAVTTVTVQIVALITGDTSAETAAGPAFTLGFTLFLMTLLMNVVALRIVRRYRESYD